MTDPLELAKDLQDIDGVDGVRASMRRVTVAVAPDERHVEQLPEDVHDDIQWRIGHTTWKPEYNGRDVEKHSWSGGVHHSPVVDSGSQPAGYELQYHLVR